MPEEKIKVIVRRLPTYIAKFVSLSVKPTSFAYEQEFTIDYTIRNEGTGILDAFEINAAIDDRPLRKVGDGSTQYIKLNPGETKSGSFVRKLMHDYPTADLSLGSHSLEVLLFVTPEGADEPIDVSTDERKLPITLIAPTKLSAPTNIRATGGIDPDFAYVEWNAVMECDGACEYNIWLDGVKRTEKAFSPTPGIDLEELDAGRTYKLEIQTKTPSGASYKTPSDKVSYSFTTPTAPEVTCDKTTPHYDSGCKLLLHYDDNNDGVLDVTDLTKAKIDGMTKEEVDFIGKGIMKDSINTLCPNCYTAPQKPGKTITVSDIKYFMHEGETDFNVGFKYSGVTKEELKRVVPTMKILVDGVSYGLANWYVESTEGGIMIDLPYTHNTPNPTVEVPWSETTVGGVIINAGKFAVPNVTLTGTIFRFESTPSGAEIWLDGKNTGNKAVGYAPIRAPLGPHIIELKMAGYPTYKKNVTIQWWNNPDITYDFTAVAPKPVTITPSELRWTDGTYRAAFRIGDLVPATEYSIIIEDFKEKVTGVTSYEMITDIPKEYFDVRGYHLYCKVFNLTDFKWEASEGPYTVPPYEIKGRVDISRSTIPTTIYLEESALFDMMVENTGDVEREYAVPLTFKNVDTGEEFKFTPENTIRVPARGKGANRIAVVMPSTAIPVGEDRATFDLIYKVEVW